MRTRLQICPERKSNDEMLKVLSKIRVLTLNVYVYYFLKTV